MSAPEPRAILIGGSSHSGKSTVAAALGARPGWTHISTDSLARHPGRPWAVEAPQGQQSVKPHVAAHYRDLSVDELIIDVLRHYRSMWPGIEALVTCHVEDKDKPCLVLEGSALWPEQLAKFNFDNVAAVWLTASDDLFEARIRRSSQYETRDTEARVLIDKFIARTLRYNALMMEAVGENELASLDVARTTPGGEDLVPLVLEHLAVLGSAKPDAPS